MTVGSLFAGIGGFDLGLERAGFEIKWQVEIDPYCQQVLAKHWPNVQRYGDIKAIDWSTAEPVELICGGFPCQPVSVLGKQRGEQDARWLWPEYLRCIQSLRPRYVLVENVPGLLDNRLLGTVLGTLAASGFDAEWRVFSACEFGAPHTRERLFLLAYPEGTGTGMDERRLRGLSSQEALAIYGRAWQAESDVDRMANGVSRRVDRIRGLGNAVVPQIVEWIGRRIMECHLASTPEQG